MPPDNRVTAGVSRTALVPAEDGEALMRVDRISYTPGAHTHWHIHTAEQILYGEDGRGWVKFKSRARIDVTPGAVVRVRVGVPHWHGATPTDSFVHLAVTAGGTTEWLGEVTPDDYEHDEQRDMTFDDK